ncbi:MAG: NUDIX domain-containing protein [Nanoarchaeota archaeon]
MLPLLLSGNLIINEKKEIYLLYRNDHLFYETPGGKVKPEECKDYSNPTIEELEMVARRELREEVAGIESILSMSYFQRIEFYTPDGREALAHKFITGVKGLLRSKEKGFDKEKSRWISLKELYKYPLSPDLKLLVPALQLLK